VGPRPVMSASMPWASAPPQLQSNDPNAILQRIDRNTTSLLSWVKGLMVVVLVLGVIIIIVA
jgi:hypothetical protein